MLYVGRGEETVDMYRGNFKIEDYVVERRALQPVITKTGDGAVLEKGGAVYGRRCALCPETEYYPDSVHFPAFPQPVFAAGERYRAETVYRFC